MLKSDGYNQLNLGFWWYPHSTAQTPQLDGGNNAGATTVTAPMEREGKEVSGIMTMTPAQQGWYPPCNVGNSNSATRAKMPSWQGQRRLHINNGNDAIVTRARTPDWHNNNTIATRATMLLWWWQRCLACKDPCTSTMATPLQQGGQCQLDNSKEACALMMAITPLLRGQQCQLNDYASLTMAEMPSQWGQHLPLQWWQRCLRINGKNAIAMRATMSPWWWQGCLCIDNDEDTIAMRATMPAWGQQWHHFNEGNSAVPDQGQRCHCYEGNDASSMTARTSAHWQWQQGNCHEAENCNGDNGKDACASTGMAPSHNDEWQGKQHYLNNAGDACALTMATMPSWQEQQLPWRQWQRCLRINGNGTIMMRATMPAWQWATRVTMLAQWWWRRLCINDGNDSITTMAKMPVTINVLTMALIAQPNFQKKACGISSHVFAALGWGEGWFGINWVVINWSPLNWFHLDSFLRFYPPKLHLSLVSSSKICPH
jgi:hypothetical protein